MNDKSSPVFVGAATVAPGNGGIARVARLTIKALGGESVEAISLLDAGVHQIAATACRGMAGSRTRFTARTYLAGLKGKPAFYDSAGIARAHPWFLAPRHQYATWIHGIEVWESLRSSRWNAIKAAKLVLVNSNYTLERYRSLHGDLAQARVCWLATEEDDLPSDPPDFSGPPTVLMLSRIETGETYKGHNDVLAAWPEVVAMAPDARLVIVGGGSGFEAVRALAEVSPVADKIIITGFVPEAEIAQYWKAAHVFCMPSRCEGFGLVYAEAMRHGLPVIASIHDAGSEVNSDGVSGYNVDLDSPGELAQRLIALVIDQARAQQIGVAAQRRWRDLFSYSAFLKRFNNIVRPIMIG